MRRTLLAGLVLALLAGCAAPPEPEEAPTGQIDGAVVDQLLRPFDGQAVHIVQLGLRDESSPLGGFTFREVPIGTYTLLASRDGYRSAAAVVDVEEGRVTRVILQLLPVPTLAPYFVAVPHRGEAQLAVAGDECASCSWSVPIEGRPQEVVLEASWEDATPLAGDDDLDFEVEDDLGNLLFRGTSRREPAQPFRISIAGADLHEDASRLDVRVAFAEGFTTRPRFVVEEVATFYYGATRDGLFFV